MAEYSSKLNSKSSVCCPSVECARKKAIFYISSRNAEVLQFSIFIRYFLCVTQNTTRVRVATLMQLGLKSCCYAHADIFMHNVVYS